MLTKRELRISKMLSLEWLGQTLASLCWIISVFVYGIDSTGDWLQLCAASCWMLSNIATIVAINPGNIQEDNS
ncbi:MAG: hypothetical protein CMB13_04435 [Euryarchaeota archaeon]|nr:hypothetical protein [Euryarchaeota archaeon]